MALEIKARGKVMTDEKGRYYLHVDNEYWWRGELSKFEPGTAVEVSIKKWYKRRSLDQNSLFHGYVGIMADELGYDPDTMKLLVKMKWLKVPLLLPDGSEAGDPETGEPLFELRETRSLSTFEMAELCDKMREWALNGFGIKLPLPEEQNEIKFKKQ